MADSVQGPLVSRSGPEAQPGTRIMIVDDEYGIGSVLIEMLASFGYEAKAFTDGESAIAAAAARSFDVVFLDVRMPGLNGVETLTQLRKLLPHATFVMITADIASSLVADSLELGACLCLPKPLSIGAILEVLKQLPSGQPQD